MITHFKAGIRNAVAICVVGLVFTASAYATTVHLSGTHSKSEIQGACGKVNGIMNSGPNGTGYGCYNPKNGVLLACNDAGSCFGIIPRRQQGLPTIGGLLGLAMSAPATVEPNMSSLTSRDNGGGHSVTSVQHPVGVGAKSSP